MHARAPEQLAGDESPQASLVRSALCGERAAWRELQEQWLPQLERWARTHSGLRRRKLAGSIDDVRDVVVATLARIEANDFAGLRKLCAVHVQCSQSELQTWLYGALDFAVREHLRARFGRLPRGARTGAELGPNKRDIQTLASRIESELADAASGITAQLSAREIAAYVAQHFSPSEVEALQRYLLDDSSFEALAAQLGLPSAAEAQRLIRKLKERLRSHFRPDV